ncbi:MAG: hypothetical protein HAW63_04905 [Bdellovibrionaceae bacterium]|nr:hypothetical protein [Pseudobdellovibrionaceae bacterium]
MFKSLLLSLIFLLAISSCKTFKGNIEVKRSLPITIIQDDPFSDDENGDEDTEELHLTLKPGVYTTELNFSGKKNLSLDINVGNEEYTIDAYLNKEINNISKKGVHKITLTAKELNQSWGLKGTVKTKVFRGDLIQSNESCSVSYRYLECYPRGDYKKHKKRVRDRYRNCKWFYDIEYGNRDVEYYNQTKTYDINTDIISAKSNAEATAKLENILGTYTAQRQENTRIYQYQSCCYDYRKRCISSSDRRYRRRYRRRY